MRSALLAAAAVVCAAQTPLPLTNGLPVSSLVATRAYAYFSFNLSSVAGALGAAVSFVVTPGAGDPDLYISNSTALPVVAGATWSSVRAARVACRGRARPAAGAGAGVAPPSLRTHARAAARALCCRPPPRPPASCAPRTPHSQATEGPEFITVLPSDPSYSSFYTLGVFGYSALPESSFTVLAYVALPNSSVTLLPGLEQAGIVPAHSFAYYSIAPAPGAGDLAISAAPLSGTVDVYVSVSGGTPTVYCAAPYIGAPGNCTEWDVVPSSYDFSSAVRPGGVADFVVVPNASIAAGTPVRVGILATSPDGFFLAPPSTYAVVASYASGSTRLLNGLAVAGIVNAAAVRQYNFTFFCACALLRRAPAAAAAGLPCA